MALTCERYNLEARGSLTGVRVLDLSRLVCGNTLTMLLADFGAEVVKVEPTEGDPLRAWKTAGIEAHWKNLGRNKLSLCIDFRRVEAIEIVKKLVSTSNVFVESFRPGTLEKIGLGPSVLFEINPKIIVTRISGWGQTGPYSQKPGFGTLVEGMSGLASMSGFPDREPLLPPNAMADSVAGLAGAMATLGALRNVEVNGGNGQIVDLSLFDPLFSVLGPQALNHRLTGQVKQRTGSRSSTAGPRNAYRTSDDKWVALSASTQAMAERLFRVIDRPDLIDNPRYRTNADRVENGDELDAIIGAFIVRLSQAEATAFFDKAEVTIGPIYDISQIVDDPHVQARGTIVEMPDEDLGTIPMHGMIARLSETPGAFRRPAPRLGQHTSDILTHAGIGPKEISRLVSNGIVRSDLQRTASAESKGTAHAS